MIKGVLFDKDGTLLRFADLWLDASRSVIRDFCFINHIPFSAETESWFLEVIGVKGNCIRQDGALAYMSYEQIGEVIAKALLQRQTEQKKGIEDAKRFSLLAGRQISVLFETVLEHEKPNCVPTCDLRHLFGELKRRNIRTGLATADNVPMTKRCLEQLGIENELEFIGCDDGILKPKPEKDMFIAFCNQYQLNPKEVAVVGDTVNDMRFAKRCGGMAVGTLCGLAGRTELEKIADTVVETPLGILNYV